MKKLSEVFWYFFRLGMVGFGGPLALIAQMQKELVDDRKWISSDEFSQTFALVKAMPGPVATQMAVYLGRRYAGRWAGLIAGVMLILPSYVLMIVLAAMYSQFIASPWVVTFMAGLQMGALALIFYSLKPLTQSYWNSRLFWILLVIGFALTLTGLVPEYLLIPLLGCWALIVHKNGLGSGKKLASFAPSGLLLVELIPGLQNYVEPQMLEKLFWICLRAGAFIFGSGLAIIPALQADFVTHNHWVTADEFRDGLAFGQMTPGPVIITVTFLGYKMAGFWGATIATIAVFAPAFFHHLTWFPRAMDYLSKTSWIRTFLLGAIAAVAAGIIFVIVEMTKGISPFQGVLFVVCLLLLLRSKIQPPILILGAGGASVLMAMI